ncbi:hypothetical protein KsCSTR_21130 [Candidatus Kuenenia stuttgartiensis]|uniref:Uncharacterized protein n=1 Tax=Kuenenia stuttgartiensis TaxID=174633 RepID=A0A6G7GQ35_KUEST|nr:hypothetical protein KsCSTR_21130 [Candidatus Kuenenia stuttgartiensis]
MAIKEIRFLLVEVGLRLCSLPYAVRVCVLFFPQLGKVGLRNKYYEDKRGEGDVCGL